MKVVAAIEPPITSPLLIVHKQSPSPVLVKVTCNGAHPSKMSPEKLTSGKSLTIISIVAAEAHSPVSGVYEYVAVPTTSTLMTALLNLATAKAIVLTG